MLDINRTVKLVSGALLDREATWSAYLPEAADWKKTAILLTGPLIVVSALVAYAIGLVTGGGMFRPTIASTILTIVMGAIGAGVVSFIVSFLAGTFGGKSSFALGLAAVTLAFVPGYVGQALVWLPWVGGLLALGLGIYSLVQLWQIIPSYLEVPPEKRTLHYVATIIATIVVMAVLSSVIRPSMPGAAGPFGGSGYDPATGMLPGGMGRHAAVIEAAGKDEYAPPADGRLTERQVETYVAVMQKVNKAMAESVERLEAMEEKAGKDDRVSAANIGTMMSGLSEIGGMATAEMQIVKAEGGNWAEHRWVGDTLMSSAWLKDSSEAAAYNHRFYEKYAEQLRDPTQP